MPGSITASRLRSGCSVRPRELERGLSIRRLERPEASRVEVQLTDEPDRVLVVDDQDEALGAMARRSRRQGGWHCLTLQPAIRLSKAQFGHALAGRREP